MLERTGAGTAAIAASEPSLTSRRALFAALVAGTMIGMLWLAAVALSPGGLDVADIALLVLFALTLPWQVIGLWNAVVGLVIMRACRDPAAQLRRTGLDLADHRIAVLDRERKRAPHEGRAHALILALRHAPGKYQPFGAAAQRAVQGMNADLVGSRNLHRFGPDFGLAGSDVP